MGHDYYVYFMYMQWTLHDQLLINTQLKGLSSGWSHIYSLVYILSTLYIGVYLYMCKISCIYMYLHFADSLKELLKPKIENGQCTLCITTINTSSSPLRRWDNLHTHYNCNYMYHICTHAPPHM